jgi:hypothetical protein
VSYFKTKLVFNFVVLFVLSSSTGLRIRVKDEGLRIEVEGQGIRTS